MLIDVANSEKILDLREGQKRRSRQMTVIKPGLEVFQGLCLVDAFNRNAAGFFRCQSRLNQVTT
tara:strand:- start:110 stop:301 length:192 start_codon:yes stop_codon:yes gene_type:complete